MIYNIIQKFGINKLVILITLLTVIISGSVTMVTLYLFTGEIYIIGLLLSTIVPGVLAPLQIKFYFLNIIKQKAAENKLQEIHGKLESEYKKVSEQREELRQLNVEMEDIVAERTKKLEKTLKEKETLLTEIHHRVKNNLQIVISLLRLRITRLEDKNVRQMLTDIESKIMAMALIHEQLYNENNFSGINMNIFLNNLIDNIFASYVIVYDHIQIIKDIEPVILDLTCSIPLSIIITEIITNSLKYAFPDKRKGSIAISLKKSGADKIIMSIRDNGIGCGHMDQPSQTSLGIKIINTLVKQLNGTIEMKCDNGVGYSITLPTGEAGSAIT